MSTVTATAYGGFLDSLAGALINFGSGLVTTPDTFMVMLLTSGYTPSDTHRYLVDLGSNEVTGTGYTPGGQALTGVTTAYASDTLSISAANVTWGATTPYSTITANYAVIYDNTPVGVTTPTSAQKPLIGYVNFGGAVSSTGGPFSIDWTGGVVLQITHS